MKRQKKLNLKPGAQEYLYIRFHQILNSACELELTHTSLSDAEQILENWMDLTGTPQEARVTISEAMERELAGGPATGMQPFRRDGALGFRHSWAIFIGKKAGS